MRFQVLVRLKEGVLDVQGKAIESGLKDKKLDHIANVTVGKVIEFDLEGKDPKAARGQVEELCKMLLANPVIERYEIKEVA
jgi:phosphoribosylformylglycinamidine synthase PurS subunit